MTIDLDFQKQILFAGYTFMFFLLGVFFLRKRIWSIFDPLLITLIFVASNAAIVVLLDQDYTWTIFILVSYLAFLIGLNSNKQIPTIFSHQWACGPGKETTWVFLSVAIIFQAISTIFIIQAMGLGVLGGENVFVSKVTIYQGGFGIFRHLNSAASLLFLPLLVHAYFIHRMKVTSLLGIIWFLFQNIIFNFSKSGFVFIIFDLGILMYYYQISIGKQIISNKLVLLVGALGFIPAIIVLNSLVEATGMTMQDQVLKRLIHSAAGTYGYFIQNGFHAFDHLSFIDRLVLYLDAPLSILKIKEWSPLTYMAMMVENLTGLYLPGFGPNPYLFLDGHFLFGWGGILYCFVLGWIISYVRSLKTNIIYFYILVKVSLTLPADLLSVTVSTLPVLLFLPIFVLLTMIADIQNKRVFVRLSPIARKRS